MQRGERIVGDLRLGGADRREERGLAGVRKANQARVGDQLEPQPDRALVAGLARIGAARRAIGRRFEMRVAKPAIAALGQHHAITQLGEVGEQCFVVLVIDLRAGRNLEHHVGSARAGAVLRPCHGRRSSP